MVDNVVVKAAKKMQKVDVKYVATNYILLSLQKC